MLNAERLSPILVVSDASSDVDALREMAASSGWTVDSTASCVQAMDAVRHGSYPVLIIARRLADGDWRDLLRFCLSLSRPPRLIVFCRHADDALWAEVLNLGGFDVLLAPFRHQEVAWALDSARRSWLEDNWAAAG